MFLARFVFMPVLAVLLSDVDYQYAISSKNLENDKWKRY